MNIKEVRLDSPITEELIALSEEWEREGSCRGYRKNTPEDLEGNRIFLARDGGVTVGYLFGHMKNAEKKTSIYEEGTHYFEIEEIYVKPERRGHGAGKELFRYAESAVSGEADMIMLSTATKNFHAILHFYIDELGMEFWSARLFKNISKGESKGGEAY